MTNNLYHIVVLMPADKAGEREERIHTIFGRPQAFRKREELQTSYPKGTRVGLPKLQSIETRNPVC